MPRPTIGIGGVGVGWITIISIGVVVVGVVVGIGVVGSGIFLVGRVDGGVVGVGVVVGVGIVVDVNAIVGFHETSRENIPDDTKDIKQECIGGIDEKRGSEGVVALLQKIVTQGICSCIEATLVEIIQYEGAENEVCGLCHVAKRVRRGWNKDGKASSKSTIGRTVRRHG